MTKISLIASLIFLFTTSAQADEKFAVPGGESAPSQIATPQWRDDGKIYKLVCDPTNSAAFLRGLIGKPQCTYMETSAIDYIKKHDRPCDNSFTGQFLRGFLGRACETTKSLRFSDADYAKYSRCDESFWNQFKAGLLSKDPCEYKFEKKEK